MARRWRCRSGRMRAGGRTALMIAVAMATGMAAPALAQLSSSLSVDSDYRYRGLSVSDHRPAVRLDLDYDHASGAYGGLSLVGARDTAYGNVALSYVAYAGYVWQARTGPAWEAGVSKTHIRDGADYDFTELYGGMVARGFTARLYYAPHYYGGHIRTLYSEFSTSKRLSTNWRAFLRGGVLTPLDGWHRRERYDLRAGLAISLSHYEIQAAWSKTNPLPAYREHPADKGDALVLSASAFF